MAIGVSTSIRGEGCRRRNFGMQELSLIEPWDNQRRTLVVEEGSLPSRT